MDTEKYAQLIRSIIGRLGPKWTYTPQHFRHGATTHSAQHNTGGKLSFRLDRGRLHISGCFPHADGEYFPARDGYKHKITVATSRDPLPIARDIERRLLPHYLIEYAQADARKRRYLHQVDEQIAIALQIARALNTGISPGDTTVYVPSHLPGYGKFRVNLGGTVDLEPLRGISPREALEIARILNPE